MSESLLDPGSSPGALRAGVGAGTRRVNRLPLAAAGAVALVAAAALVYAILQRAPSPEESAADAAVEDALPRPSSRAAYESVVAGFEDDGEIPAGPETAPATPEAVAPVIVPVVPEPPPVPSELDEWRFDLLRDAVAASPVVEAAVTQDMASERAEGPPSSPAVPAGERDELLAQALAARQGDPAVLDPNLRARKEAFAGRERRFGPSFARREPPLSPHEVKAGTVIPAVLVGGIDSDLPGLIMAQVSRAVLDTRAGEAVLIPQGARLIGSYDHHVALGQRRVMVAWHRIQFPDASTLDLGGMPGADAGGFAGFRDQVDNHYLRTFGSATMLSVLGAGAQLSQPDRQDGRLAAEQEVAGEFGRQWGEVGRETVRRNMRIQPTLRIRPGYQFNVVVTKDLILAPYGDG